MSEIQQNHALESQKPQELISSLDNRMQEANLPPLTSEQQSKLQSIPQESLKEVYTKIDTLIQMCLDKNGNVSKDEANLIKWILDWQLDHVQL